MSQATIPSPARPAPVNGLPTRLLLIRHAEVEARYQSVFGGHIDMDLSPRGHEQAAALAKYLRHAVIDATYASPMKRVQQTLQALASEGIPKATIMADLREVSFGDWTGLTWSEVQTRYGIGAWQWLHQLEAVAIQNAESAQTLRERVEPCLRQIIRDHPGQQVAIVCHGGVIRMILAILLDLPLSRTGAFQIEYGSLTRVSLRPEFTELQLVNFTPWRDGAP